MKKAMPNFNSIFKLVKIGGSPKTYKRLTISLLLTVLITAIGPILAFLSKVNVDLLEQAFEKGALENYKNFFVVAFITILLSLLSIGANKLRDIEQTLINHYTAKKINSYIYKRISVIDYQYFENSDTYDVITRVIGNSPSVYSVLNSGITVIISIISAISYGLLLSSIKWYFIPIILLPSVLCVWADTKNLFERYFLSIMQTNDNRKLGYMHSILRDKRCNKEIRAFNICDTLIEKYEALRVKLYKQGQRLLFKQSSLSFALVCLSKIGLFICLYIVCKGCLAGTNSIGDITLVLSAGTAFSGAFDGIFSQINTVTDKANYLNDWDVFENMKEEAEDTQELTEINAIEFNDVSYSYPHSDSLALTNVSCKIRKGSVIALVGENGSGKSTFIKALVGALTPISGNICINTFDLNKVLRQFRNKVSYIPQDYAKFKVSLEENLKLGNESIDMSLYKPTFIDFQEKLPSGFDTTFGDIYPNSIDLSGGEWQRIAIERALLRKKSEIYIMDEPAASLDPIMESELYEHFASELKGKTILVTSHRLGACALADYIYVFDKGKIIERGNHNELMEQKGKYFDMYSAQRKLYERNG